MLTWRYPHLPLSGRSPDEEGTETCGGGCPAVSSRPAEVLMKKELKQCQADARRSSLRPAEVLMKKELKHVGVAYVSVPIVRPKS